MISLFNVSVFFFSISRSLLTQLSSADRSLILIRANLLYFWPEKFLYWKPFLSQFTVCAYYSALTYLYFSGSFATFLIFADFLRLAREFLRIRFVKGVVIILKIIIIAKSHTYTPGPPLNFHFLRKIYKLFEFFWKISTTQKIRKNSLVMWILWEN